MKQSTWYILLGLSLVLFSMVTYFVQNTIFHKPEDTVFYMLQDIAFLPIQVLIVTMIINELLNRREKLLLLRKLNMVIGVFFSEVGTGLLRRVFEFDHTHEDMGQNLLVTEKWSEQDFAGARKLVSSYKYKIDSRKADLESLRLFLLDKRPFILSLMENSNLLEHESFTDLLLAVSHLTEELVSRSDLKGLQKPDLDHISVDMKRAHMLLTIEWLAYMKHLKDDYPFLFSFAVRTNPFNPTASPEVR